MKMKYIKILALGFGLASCEKDNFEPPQSVLEGRIVYNGEPIMVQSANTRYNNNSDFPVFIELWEKAYQNRSSIRIPIKQDGSFSMALFNGDYKLVVPNGQGPFMWKRTPQGTPDSLAVSLQGSQTLDIEVMPYYMLRNAQFSNVGRKVSGNVKIDKIITDINAKNIDRVSLYVNKTQFVDDGNNISRTDLSGSAITDMNNVRITSSDINTIVPSQSYAYARIGIRIAGVDDMIYSPVQRVELQ